MIADLPMPRRQQGHDKGSPGGAQAGAGLPQARQQELAAHFPPAHVAIWAAVARLAPGTVASYGQIARRAGMPRCARLVSRALGKAPATLRLPWHRVLRADGRIAFAPGSDPFNRQRRLLEREGILVTDRGRVGMVSQLSGESDSDLDAHLWRLPSP